MLKIDQLKLQTAVKQCQAYLSLIDPFVILAKHGELTLTVHPMKNPGWVTDNGYEEFPEDVQDY